MPDPSLEDTVNGILKFMHRKGIISVAVREDRSRASDGHRDRFARCLQRTLRYCFLKTSFSVMCWPVSSVAGAGQRHLLSIRRRPPSGPSA